MDNFLNVIVNPLAGRGQARRQQPDLERALSEYGFHPRFIETRSVGHATELARELVREEAETVGVAGGDGTIREVASALVGTDVNLALFPLGTGNDLARTLGIGLSLSHAAQLLASGHTRAIDAGFVLGQVFLSVAGCGFDAAVANRKNTGFRFLKGTSAYLAAMLTTLRTYRASMIKVTVDEDRFEGRAMLCSVANGRFFGGGMMVAPNAEVDDGLFDVYIVGEVGRAEFIRVFPRVFRGTHTSHPKVTMMRGAKVNIESVPPISVLTDGDLAGATPATFELRPKALRIFCP